MAKPIVLSENFTNFKGIYAELQLLIFLSVCHCLEVLSLQRRFSYYSVALVFFLLLFSTIENA